MATIRCKGHEFEQIETVLFDKDGTLANVEAYLYALGWARSQQITRQIPELSTALTAAMGITDGTIDPTGMMAVASRQESEIAAAACVAATGLGWIASRELVAAAFIQAAEQMGSKAPQTPPIIGTQALISRLYEAGIKVGIVSSDSHLEIGNFVEHHHIIGIDWYCGASDTTKPKTHPAFLQFACQALDTPPERTLVIGDSAADLTMAAQGSAGFLGMIGGWQCAFEIPNAEITFKQLDRVECFD